MLPHPIVLALRPKLGQRDAQHSEPANPTFQRLRLSSLVFRKFAIHTERFLS